MVDPLTLAAFIPAALALNLTPGVDMMFSFAQGLKSGPKAALAAVAGISLGGMVHVLLAGLGLGTVMAAWPWSFDLIRWAGVCYLLWLAFKMFGSAKVVREAGPGLSAAEAFRTGLLINLMNPKVILFVLAFVPQFIRPEAGPVLGQFLVFGVVIGLGGFFVNGAVGVFASGIGQRMVKGGRLLGWISGGIFVALAARLALLERS